MDQLLASCKLSEGAFDSAGGGDLAPLAWECHSRRKGRGEETVLPPFFTHGGDGVVAARQGEVFTYVMRELSVAAVGVPLVAAKREDLRSTLSEDGCVKGGR